MLLHIVCCVLLSLILKKIVILFISCLMLSNFPFCCIVLIFHVAIVVLSLFCAHTHRVSSATHDIPYWTTLAYLSQTTHSLRLLSFLKVFFCHD